MNNKFSICASFTLKFFYEGLVMVQIWFKFMFLLTKLVKKFIVLLQIFIFNIFENVCWMFFGIWRIFCCSTGLLNFLSRQENCWYVYSVKLYMHPFHTTDEFMNKPQCQKFWRFVAVSKWPFRALHFEFLGLQGDGFHSVICILLWSK